MKIKKSLKKILLISIILCILITTFICLIGYNYYFSMLKEIPLLTRVTTLTSMDNYVTYDDLPEDYINAVIAVEDHRYYDHGAIDIISLGRATITNIQSLEIVEGGSTITQQLAKNLIFTQNQTFVRKVAEVFAAIDLEKNYTKNEIFAMYVNIAYFGDGYYGIYDASMGYYGKEPSELTLDEASMLAGIPNAPSLYSPTVNPELASQRQSQVLSKMLEYGYITEAQMN